MKTIKLLLILVIMTNLFSCSTPNNKFEFGSTENSSDFEIVGKEDQTRKAMGEKSLSEFTSQELENLPDNKKMIFKIVMSKEFRKKQLDNTINKILIDLTKKNPDLDEIVLWLYSSKEMIGNPYDIGSVIWAPNGKLGGVDPHIALNNDRTSYKITKNINDNLDSYLEQKHKNETKFGFSEQERKKIYKEIANSERIVEKIKIKKEDKVLDKLVSKYGKLNDEAREILKKEMARIEKEIEPEYIKQKQLVLDKYNLTKEQEELIIKEANEENWPLY